MGKLDYDVHVPISKSLSGSEFPCQKCNGTDFVLELKVGKYLSIVTLTCTKCRTVQDLDEYLSPHRE